MSQIPRIKMIFLLLLGKLLGPVLIILCPTLFLRIMCLPPFHAFISQVFSVVILDNVNEALNVPKWMEVIFEDVRALEKNAAWEKVDLPQGKLLLVVSGYSF